MPATTPTTKHHPDVVVVGGGLAGLTAAATAARAGATVTLFEARDELGGRARTDSAAGFRVNQGPHALYRGGAGLPILRELGVEPEGHTPRQRSGQWVRAGATTPFRHLGPIGGVRGLGVVRPLVSSRRAEAAHGRPLDGWLDEYVRPEARPFAEMLIRTTGYGVDFAHMDAGAALDQVRRGARNVLYLHGGWSTLVDGLRAAAAGAGVTISHEKVAAVTSTADGVVVTLGSGTTVEAGAAVLAAGGPSQADHLLDGASPTVARWAAQARPVRAACLDLSLRRRPRRGPVVAYGLDEPIYLVDHSASARLAPDSSALVHCLWYEPDLAPEVDHRARLEAAMDLLQPGWRDDVVEARFSRRLVVAQDRPQPDVAETDRPQVVVADQPGVFVAGDWITGEGLLADASLASGRSAGRAAAVAVVVTPSAQVHAA